MARKAMMNPPVHPGEILKELFHEAGVSSHAAGLKMRIPANRLTTIISGKRAITADTALRLACLFGNSAGFWMNLQKNYELDLARYELAGRIEREVEPLRRAS